MEIYVFRRPDSARGGTRALTGHRGGNSKRVQMGFLSRLHPNGRSLHPVFSVGFSPWGGVPYSARAGGHFRKSSTTGSELPSTTSSGVLVLPEDEDFDIAEGTRGPAVPQEGLAPGTLGVDSEPPQGRNGASSPVGGLLEIVTGQRDRFRQRFVPPRVPFRACPL